jgi:hypothetical protein
MKNFNENIRYANQAFLDQHLIYDGNDLRPSSFKGRKSYILSDRPELNRLINTLGPLIQNLDNLTDEQISNGVFYIYFTYDMDALPLLKKIKNMNGIYVSPSPLIIQKTEYCYGINRNAHLAMSRTWANSNRVSHLTHSIHENICEAIEITKHLDGDYVEIGVYKGGSALTAMNYIQILMDENKIKERSVYLLDTFDGFNYEEALNSSDIIWKNTHKLYGAEETMDYLKETFNGIKLNYTLYKNNICVDSLPGKLKKISVANIDVDMYEPTLYSLMKTCDLVVPGGVIICEDAASTPALYGAYLAMEDFLETEKGKQFTKVFKTGQYFLIKHCKG